MAAPLVNLAANLTVSKLCLGSPASSPSFQYCTLHSHRESDSFFFAGTMTFGEQNSSPESLQLLGGAVEAGINFFNSAEMYPVVQRAETQGRSEEYLGRWIRESKTIHHRFGHQVMDYVMFKCSLRRLQTDYIDLYQIHWPDRFVSMFTFQRIYLTSPRFGETCASMRRAFSTLQLISDCFRSYVPMFGETEYDPTRQFCSIPMEGQLDSLGRAVDSGKIRYVGLSNETPYGVMKFVQVAERSTCRPKIVSLQNAYNLLCRTYDSGLAECCHHERISLLAYSPLAMAFVLSRLIVANVIFGATKSRQLQEVLDGCKKVELNSFC
ncbi:hypothetical protein C1H46_024441 [Malus baccata]|uniref:NADP-dependent oxidoreductase domain-containing protein n=1 Tax=Malus baccata TaxID=106549 RepID=A0A540LU94_MALBA|nr:hypothetical protein C1H46_024441 [Malus baccata]